MISVAILAENEFGKDEVDVIRHLVDEFRQNDIDVIESNFFEPLPESECVILLYNTYTGVTPGFEAIARKLVESNVKPIILIINAQNRDVDYVKIGDRISKVWGDINPDLYSNSVITFYYENDKKIAYQVKTGEEQGICELIDIVKILKQKMTFF